MVLVMFFLGAALHGTNRLAASGVDRVDVQLDADASRQLPSQHSAAAVAQVGLVTL